MCVWVWLLHITCHALSLPGLTVLMVLDEVLSLPLLRVLRRRVLQPSSPLSASLCCGNALAQLSISSSSLSSLALSSAALCRTASSKAWLAFRASARFSWVGDKPLAPSSLFLALADPSILHGAGSVIVSSAALLIAIPSMDWGVDVNNNVFCPKQSTFNAGDGRK